MSIAPTHPNEAIVLCEIAMSIHTGPAERYWSPQRIRSLFRAVLIAQRAAAAHAYGDELDVREIPDFNDVGPDTAILARANAYVGQLHRGLRLMTSNIVDKQGNTWLPDRYRSELAALQLATAERAAGYLLTT
ncbi:hypothetical protein GCM10012275_42820 [Longimycelium tulufanense]|uniref:Uncharacterized protein n=1 Tax=Longimycelium tulufanense TaxID=907463 RepID=A0A8J3CGY0_9PSEU|nr:hypothetical protein [Longimycelium tulufanense]GGM67672.1 hypothetical protein GCM10012275_42820 [Longimycelium tulufanense]